MTAWQYFAGAGLVAVLCPLHGHVAVAGDADGHGRGARLDVCVPGGHPKPPVVRPPAPPVSEVPGPPVAVPSVRVTLPGAERPTVHHPGQAPGLPAAAPGPDAPVPDGPAQPSPAPPAPAPGPEPVPAEAPAPPAVRAAAPARAFHVRPYRSAALERRAPNGLSTMMLMVVVTTPAVLAAAALRPRSKSRG
ncbi:hypothetical protein [Streptomyces lavendulae]